MTASSRSSANGVSPETPCRFEHHRSEAAALLALLVSRLVGAMASDQTSTGSDGASGAAAAKDSPDLRAAEMIDVVDPSLLGRVLAAPAMARTAIPAFDNSQMDGYAVRAADLADASADSPVSLLVGTTTAAGDAPVAHSAGSASPTMTGAALPLGADAIVPIEEALPPRFGELSRAGDPPAASRVAFAAAVPAGRFVRRRGEDLPAGAPVGEAGTRVTPALIGALAAAGIERVAVRPQPRVLLCATGDELRSPDPSNAALAPGRIHDANTPMLRAELHRLGARVTTIRTTDRAADFREALVRAANDVDVIVTMGGISEGAFEVVREALGPMGVSFHPVAMQPGGPQGLGRLDFGPSPDGAATTVPVLCFPGNPVSAALSLELFLAPVLREIAGLPRERSTRRLPLAHEVESPPAKHQIRRGTLDADGRVVVSAPGSHLVHELASAELLVHIPVGVARAPAGSLVDTWRFND